MALAPKDGMATRKLIAKPHSAAIGTSAQRTQLIASMAPEILRARLETLFPQLDREVARLGFEADPLRGAQVGIPDLTVIQDLGEDEVLASGRDIRGGKFQLKGDGIAGAGGKVALGDRLGVSTR